MTSNSSAGATPLDVHSLTEPVDPAAVTAHARQLERTTGVRASTSRVDVGCAVVFVGIVGVPTSVLFGVLSLRHGFVWAIAAAVVLAATVALCIRVLRAASREGHQAPELRYRLERFAADNALEYVAEQPDPGHQGRVFEGGLNRRARDVVRWPGDGIEVANYIAARPGYRGMKTVTEWGYATARLDAPAPALLLDGKKNKGVFDERVATMFEIRTPTRLRAPDGGGFELWAWPRDLDAARRIVDGPLLSRLAERGADLEIVGDRLFLYSSRPLSTSDPDTWAWILDTVQAIRDRVASL